MHSLIGSAGLLFFFVLCRSLSQHQRITSLENDRRLEQPINVNVLLFNTICLNIHVIIANANTDNR
jgi:hypothetical protein